MAVSESVLNAVNLFSSTSVFNANKGSVGATDLNFIKQTTAELATEGGGIIAQSLGTNGYVKFANGLILQWGNITTAVNQGTVQLLISFQSDKYFATVDPMDDESYHTNNVGIYNRTKQSFSFAFYAGDMIRAWFCIGY